MKHNTFKIWISIIILIALSLLITYQFVEPPPPNEIRMATGREGGAYYAFALKYQKHLAEQKFRLEIQQTAGSNEVLKKLSAGDVSVGFVQGGTAEGLQTEELQSIASLFYEPLWVFYRNDLQIEYLFDLCGKRVAVGEEGSGTRSLAIQLLQDNKVTENNTTFLALSSKEARQQLLTGKIDAAFFVMSPIGSVVAKLLKNPDVELLSFKRSLAYSHRYSYLTSIKIGEGMIDLKNNIPKEDKILLTTTATLVARKDLHLDIVYLFLQMMTKIHKTGGFLEKKGQFPSDQFVELPINSDAEHFLQYGPGWLQKILPFWLACMADRLKILLIPLIAIMIPLLKSVLPLYQWGIRFKIFSWYDTLCEVEKKMYTITQLAEIEEESQKMKALQKELIEQVSVPLSYMGEFYSLRMHIQLVLEQLQERQQEILRQPSQHPSDREAHEAETEISSSAGEE